MKRDEIINGYNKAVATLEEYKNHMRRMILMDFQRVTETKVSEMTCERIKVDLSIVDSQWYLELSYSDRREVYTYCVENKTFTLKFIDKWIYTNYPGGFNFTPETVHFTGSTIKLPIDKK